ncbi:uncharacterized protein si:ch73-364h19.1 isoform X2 [Anguilla anguilla]|uniref:uncharacterized protein si:ch73-364h19.1 isoform X2 n=1 Tax=Anguilla anguilla TaxID=7936 RepID=UPI0015ACA8E7|nr:uncharacterized protein si:ch73-364h19.1 isoform X2 [Anguilla anguilla]
MPTLATPATLSSSQLTPDQLTVIVASISCLVFFVVIVVLLTILYRKDPLCCKVRAYQESHQYSEAPPQYYSSRQTLVGSTYNDPSSEMTYDNHAPPGHVFVIGQASSYHLPSMDAPLPRLPSYESVRKKDRQRQIHMMIADRFGLNATIETEPPPTYEESIRQSVVIPSVNFGSTDNLVASVAATQSTVPPHLGSQQNPSTCHDPNT